MNVDKLKKMNVLADTLKQHGLAASREDAANLAGTMVGSEEEQELSKIYVPEVFLLQLRVLLAYIFERFQVW